MCSLAMCDFNGDGFLEVCIGKVKVKSITSLSGPSGRCLSPVSVA